MKTKVEKKDIGNIQFKLLPEKDEKYAHFEAYASTFGNRDECGDIMVKGAFTKSLAKRVPALLWQHDMEQPVGFIQSAVEDEKGLLIKGILPLNDSLVKERLLTQLDCGGISSMSIGYSTRSDEMMNGARLLKEVELYECSFVTIPANPMATVMGVKSVVPYQDLPLADTETVWDATAADKRVREFTNSTEEPSDQYRRAFLWFDGEAPELFGSYKLQIADVIDGRLRAVPRGIFAAAGAMRGARGGVNIPDADRDGVRAHIERYYEKMGRESPFKSALQWIEGAQSIRDIEQVMQDTMGASANESKALISVIHRLKAGYRDDALLDAAGGFARELVGLKSVFQPPKGDK